MTTNLWAWQWCLSFWPWYWRTGQKKIFNQVFAEIQLWRLKDNLISQQMHFWHYLSDKKTQHKVSNTKHKTSDDYWYRIDFCMIFMIELEPLVFEIIRILWILIFKFYFFDGGYIILHYLSVHFWKMQTYYVSHIFETLESEFICPHYIWLPPLLPLLIQGMKVLRPW